MDTTYIISLMCSLFFSGFVVADLRQRSLDAKARKALADEQERLIQEMKNHITTMKSIDSLRDKEFEKILARLEALEFKMSSTLK